MSSSDVLVSLLALVQDASRQGAILNEFSGKSIDGEGLMKTIDQMKACLELIKAQKEKVLFETPSAARMREENAYLRGCLEKTEMALVRARHGHDISRVDFLPGLAYNLHAGPPAMATAHLIQKLEVISMSQSAYALAPPATKLEKMRELSHDVLNALSAFVPYLGVAVPSSKVLLLNELTVLISQQSRDLAMSCTDKSERKLILDALDAFEGEANAFIAGVRTPANASAAQARECAKSASVLLGCITPKCVMDLAKASSSSMSVDVSSTD